MAILVPAPTGNGAADGDRLPWLSDVRPPQPKQALPLLPLAAAAAVLVAAGSFWLGSRGAIETPNGASPASTTVTLPEPPEPRAAQVERPRSPVPEVRQPAPAVVEPPRLQSLAVRHSTPRRRLLPGRDIQPHALARVVKQQTAAPVARPSGAERPSAPLATPTTPWPARVSDGANGRLVRIGTFTTPRQAKVGWTRLMRGYPAMRRLPAVVVAMASIRDGRTYYRLQMGTTSQAHSAVLCQRMRMVALSCVVYGVQPREDAIAL